MASLNIHPRFDDSPKNYSLLLRCSNSGQLSKITKLRGFSLKHDAVQESIDFDLMKQFLLQYGRGIKCQKSVPQFRLAINKSQMSIVSKHFSKIYSNCSLNKR